MSHNAYNTRYTHNMHNIKNKDIGGKRDLIITRITCTTHITRITLTPKILGDKGVGVIMRITCITRTTRKTLIKKIISEKGV